MSAFKKLESNLDNALVKKAPFQLPEEARKLIVEWSPWINLVLGILGLLAAKWLWDAGHTVNKLVDYVSTLTQGYAAPVQKLGFFFYASLLSLIISAVLMLIAVPGLKAKSKSRGWDLAFYAVLFNLVYGVVYLFADQGGEVGRLISTAVSTIVGLYILFQIRGYYKDGARTTADKKTAS